MIVQNQHYFISQAYVSLCCDYGPLMETVWSIQENVLPQMNQLAKKK
jgi:hypothetical protein